MQESSTNDTTHPAVLAFRQDLEQQLREQVREAIETVLEAELTAGAGIGAPRAHGPAGRLSPRHRRPHPDDPRRGAAAARAAGAGPPRRRYDAGVSEPVDPPVCPTHTRGGCGHSEQLSGGRDSRRIRAALRPLLGDQHLSKSAVSRIVGRLKVLFATWQTRPPGRRALRRVVPRWRAPEGPAGAPRGRGARPRGPWGHTGRPETARGPASSRPQKRAVSWRAVLTDLQQRGLPAPRLVVTDGHAGLSRRLGAWAPRPGAAVYDPQGTKPRGGVSRACPGRSAARLSPDHLRGRWVGGPRRLRRVHQEMDTALSARRPLPRGGRPRAADVLRVPPGHVEVVAHDEQPGEPQSGIPATDEDASLVQHRGRRP